MAGARGADYNPAMSALALNFLGDLAIFRDGQPLELPPSRKTRALLAYLALTGRSFRREHLCDLLWEVPDDPRGSLRWSLSKLRRLVDDDDRERIVADRLTVRFDAADVAIDVLELADLVQHRLDTAAVEELEAAAAAWCGTPLEGLELPAFHDYSAWYMGQRERAIAQQTRLLSVLLKRLAGEPERAVQHAHTLVRIAPYDEQARAELIRLLVALGRPDDAERQYALGSRLLKEAGATPTGALHRALRDAPGQAATPPVRRLAETRCSSRRLRHDGGIVGNGIYALGLNFMRRRKSSYIHGAEDDVRELGANLVQHLHGAVHRPVTSNRHLAPSLGRFALASLNAVVSRPMRYRP